MSTRIERAVQLYEEASRAEEQGNVDRAEVLYLESRDFFLHEGGAHFIDAANIMNAIAFLKEKYGDYEGARRAAEESIQVLDKQSGMSTTREAHEVRLQAWGLIGNIHRHLAQYEKAEQVFLHAFDYARNVLGDAE